MTRLVLRRVALLPLLLIAVAAGTFILAEVSPFDPVDAYVGAESQVSPERRAEIAAGVGVRPASSRALRSLDREHRPR